MQWHEAYRIVSEKGLPPVASDADELARQIAEALRASPEMTINDIRDALDRRFGLRLP
jgi:hypothetical protein